LFVFGFAMVIVCCVIIMVLALTRKKRFNCYSIFIPIITLFFISILTTIAVAPTILLSRTCSNDIDSYVLNYLTMSNLDECFKENIYYYLYCDKWSSKCQNPFASLKLFGDLLLNAIDWNISKEYMDLKEELLRTLNDVSYLESVIEALKHMKNQKVSYAGILQILLSLYLLST